MIFLYIIMIKIYYIEDKNGKYVSEDGTRRFTKLEGREAYAFLKTPKGKKKRFMRISSIEDNEEINIEEQEEMKRIYDTVKEAKLERVDRFPDDVCGGDPKWIVTLGFEDKKTVNYSADTYSYEYGCRRYRMDEKDPGMPKAMIIISSKELYDLMDEYIPE